MPCELLNSILDSFLIIITMNCEISSDVSSFLMNDDDFRYVSISTCNDFLRATV